ncbi:MAG: XrtA/PEP-CTERM system exopolysaccharide export protein [Candidatus Thiodiazotropha sp. DIVDIV]
MLSISYMKITKFVIPFCLLLVTACSGTPEMNAANSGGTGGQDGASPSSPLYLIGPGDTLNVFVWGDQELTTDVVVRPDGLITTPLVEDLQASGKTPTQLARNLESRLSKFVKNPKVTVSVRQFVGRYTEQVRVVGQASQPQSIPFREGMTLLDVIIEVGGLTEFASGNSATIVRKINGKTSQYRVRLDDLIRDGDISANVKMMPGDVLIIPETWF